MEQPVISPVIKYIHPVGVFLPFPARAGNGRPGKHLPLFRQDDLFLADFLPSRLQLRRIKQGGHLIFAVHRLSRHIQARPGFLQENFLQIPALPESVLPRFTHGLRDRQLPNIRPAEGARQDLCHILPDLILPPVSKIFHHRPAGKQLLVQAACVRLKHRISLRHGDLLQPVQRLAPAKGIRYRVFSQFLQRWRQLQGTQADTVAERIGPDPAQPRRQDDLPQLLAALKSRRADGMDTVGQPYLLQRRIPGHRIFPDHCGSGLHHIFCPLLRLIYH